MRGNRIGVLTAIQQRCEAPVDDEQVVAIPAHDRVGPVDPEDRIIAITARDTVVPGFGEYLIVAGAAMHRVMASAAKQLIIAVAAIDQIIAGAPFETVEAAPAAKNQILNRSEDEIIGAEIVSSRVAIVEPHPPAIAANLVKIASEPRINSLHAIKSAHLGIAKEQSNIELYANDQWAAEATERLLGHANAQPNHLKYGQFSELMFKGLETAWTGTKTPAEAVDEVEVEMKATLGDDLIVR